MVISHFEKIYTERHFQARIIFEIKMKAELHLNKIGS